MPRDPLQVELDQLARGDLAGGDQLRLAGDSRVGELDALHRAAIYAKRGVPAVAS